MSTAPPLLFSVSFVVCFQPDVPGQIIDELVEGEDAEADFVVSCFGTTLKQAGEGHSRWGSR